MYPGGSPSWILVHGPWQDALPWVSSLFSGPPNPWYSFFLCPCPWHWGRPCHVGPPRQWCEFPVSLLGASDVVFLILLPWFYFPFILFLSRASRLLSSSCSFISDSSLLSRPHLLVLIEKTALSCNFLLDPGIDRSHVLASSPCSPDPVIWQYFSMCPCWISFPLYVSLNMVKSVISRIHQSIWVPLWTYSTSFLGVAICIRMWEDWGVEVGGNTQPSIQPLTQASF